MNLYSLNFAEYIFLIIGDHLKNQLQNENDFISHFCFHITYCDFKRTTITETKIQYLEKNCTLKIFKYLTQNFRNHSLILRHSIKKIYLSDSSKQLTCL